jgi:hypothetical protein
VACSLVRSVGSATFTTVTSSMSISAAMVMTAMTRADRREDCCAGVRTGEVRVDTAASRLDRIYLA